MQDRQLWIGIYAYPRMASSVLLVISIQTPHRSQWIPIERLKRQRSRFNASFPYLRIGSDAQATGVEDTIELVDENASRFLIKP